MAPGFDFGWEHAVGALGGLVQVVLAVAVYALAPRDPRHRAFAVLVFGNGVWDVFDFVLGAAASDGRTLLAVRRTTDYVELLTVAGLAAFISQYPRPRGLAKARWGMPALAVITVAAMLALAAWPEGFFTYALTEDDGVVLTGAGPLGLLGGLWFPLLATGCILILAEARRQRTAERDASSFLVATALLIYPIWSFGIAAQAGFPFDDVTGLDGRAYRLAQVVAGFVVTLAAPVLVVAIAALAWKVPVSGRRVAKTVLVVGAVAVTAGLAGGLNESIQDAAYGVSSILFGGILAYALAKHKLFGIEAKLRFAISKSTLAATFIAVFFVASEAAQQFFGERTSSTYIGIGLAGTLVFAMAPLQRVAEKFAEKAVPTVEAPAASVHGSASSRKHDVYRDALGVAFRDRRITRDEQVKLARLAQELGIGAGEAIEMMHAAEQQATRKGTKAVKR